MTSNVVLKTSIPPEAYLAVTRLNDGRYRVAFLKDGQPPRTSYTQHADQVVRQVKRAGIPLCTDDVELQRACQADDVLVLAVPLETSPA